MTYHACPFCKFLATTQPDLRSHITSSHLQNQNTSMLPVVHVKVDDQQQKRFTPSPFLHPDIDSVVQNVRRSGHKSYEDSSGRKSLSISLVNRSSFPSDTDSTTCRASHTSLNDELGNDGRVLSSNHDDDDDGGRRLTFNLLTVYNINPMIT